MILRLLGVPEAVPAGHVELDVSTLPREVVQRGRGVVQATTDELRTLQVLQGYAGVRSVVESAERLRRIELNIIWGALDRDGIPGLGWSADWPAITPWSLDHIAFWLSDEIGCNGVYDEELSAACVRLEDEGNLTRARRGTETELVITSRGRKRLEEAGGLDLILAVDDVPRDGKGKVLPLNPPARVSAEERRQFNVTVGAQWAAYHQRKRDTALRLRAQLVWDAW